MRVQTKALCYINECCHNPGDVFDINDTDFTDEYMEEVAGDTLVTRSTPAPRPLITPPISGGRELGVESDNLIPEEGAEMETHREGGKRKR